MTSTPIFSLCHPTARAPGGWVEACAAWRKACAVPRAANISSRFTAGLRSLATSLQGDLVSGSLPEHGESPPDVLGRLGHGDRQPRRSNHDQQRERGGDCSSGRVLVDVND